MRHIKMKYGFTLIELLVVVIIIAVLSAVAVPMYKHAALKSRFSKVMPVAKSIVEAQEVYYLGKNIYAANDEKDLLDVSPSGDTTIELATRDQENEYNYVAASSTEVPGARYIMYQKHSPKFAGTIQCEADVNNADALWLCEKGLKGQDMSGSIKGDGYKTFLLAGNIGTNDTFGGTDTTGEGASEQSGTTNSQPAVTPIRTLSGEPSCTPTSSGARCDYTYTTGETMKSQYLQNWTNVPTLECDDYGRCEIANRATDGMEVETLEIYRGKNKREEYRYAEGNLVWGQVISSDGGGSIQFGSDGGITSFKIKSSDNPYAVPPGSTSVVYDPQGNVWKVFNGSSQSTYSPDNPNMAQYKLSSAQMTELTSWFPETAQAVVGKDKCQVFPELYGCRSETETSN